ncbi:MAG: PilX N-terminal [Moraxellaceae bacterium]|jgi:Tfp pilus assembly protein PilX|nr:PilX N-terminal [Moraxellaceae bacterium]
MSLANRIPTSRSQRGVALLVTLVVLVVVTLMGLVAMRSGMLQVAMATNSQVNGLLFESADSGVAAVRRMVEADPEAAALPTGVVGLVEANPNDEVPGCLTKTALTMTTNMTTRRLCSPSTANDYMSARGAVQVQVAVSAVLGPDGKPLVMRGEGTDLCDTVECEGTRPIQAERTVVAVYGTAVMPSYGGATQTTVNNCFNTYKQSRGTYTVTDCLTDNNVSSRTVVQEYAFGRSGY